MATYTSADSDNASSIIPPMSTSAPHEPQKPNGPRALLITIVLSGMEASAWPSRTILSPPPRHGRLLFDCDALLARIRSKRVFWRPFPDPCFPVALAARRSGSTPVVGHGRHVDKH